MKITTIGQDSPYLEKVEALARSNAATLGFLPRDAFAELAGNPGILVALISKDLVGYLLYRIARTKQQAQIVHLCVREDQRKSGIASALFRELVSATQDVCLGIRVRCRRDYEASRLWPRLGLVAQTEMPVRSKSGSTLTVWWLDHGHPTLFSISETQVPSRLRDAIDANVFYQLQQQPGRANEVSHALLADWLQEDVELCVTDEILNEIDRRSDPGERKSARSFFGQFRKLSCTPQEYQASMSELRPCFGESLSPSDWSDLRQLARTAASGVHVFVTRDLPLLDSEDGVYRAAGVRVLHPSDLIIQQDELLREDEYQPARLAGSGVVIERVHAPQIADLDVLRAPQKERKATFFSQVRSFTRDPHVHGTHLVRQGKQILALVIHDRGEPQQLQLPLLSVARHPLAPVLARHLLRRSVLASAQEDRVLTRVSDEFLSSTVKDALSELPFYSLPGQWIKVNLQVAQSGEELCATLARLAERFPEAAQLLTGLSRNLAEVRGADRHKTLVRVEKSLWPAKMVDLEIPSFMVSIGPEWAMHLFDPGIAEQDLFGGDPHLMLNVENVYYLSARQRVLQAPARILWYVTKGSGRYQGTMAVRATSYLDSIVVGKPKALYSRFRRLGAYQWQHVLAKTSGLPDTDVMAFRFSNTEVFPRPISRDTLDEIWREESGLRFHIQAPVKIPTERFFHIYSLGMAS